MNRVRSSRSNGKGLGFVVAGIVVDTRLISQAFLALGHVDDRTYDYTLARR